MYSIVKYRLPLAVWFAVEGVSLYPVTAFIRRGPSAVSRYFNCATLIEWSIGAVQPERADCFVVPKKSDCIFLSILVFRKFFLSCCFHNEDRLWLYVWGNYARCAGFYFDKFHISFFSFSFSFSLRIAGTSVVLFALYSLHAFDFTPSSTCFSPVLWVYVCERDISFLLQVNNTEKIPVVWCKNKSINYMATVKLFFCCCYLICSAMSHT